MKKLKAILGGKLDRAVLAAKEKRINAFLIVFYIGSFICKSRKGF